MRGVIRNPRKDRLRLPPRSHEDLYVLVQSRTLRSSGLRAWEQLKQRRVWSGLNSGPARRLLLGPGMAPGEGAAMPRCSAAAGPRTMQKNRGRGSRP